MTSSFRPFARMRRGPSLSAVGVIWGAFGLAGAGCSSEKAQQPATADFRIPLTWPTNQGDCVDNPPKCAVTAWGNNTCYVANFKNRACWCYEGQTRTCTGPGATQTCLAPGAAPGCGVQYCVISGSGSTVSGRFEDTCRPVN